MGPRAHGLSQKILSQRFLLFFDAFFVRGRVLYSIVDRFLNVFCNAVFDFFFERCFWRLSWFTAYGGKTHKRLGDVVFHRFPRVFHCPEPSREKKLKKL